MKKIISIVLTAVLGSLLLSSCIELTDPYDTGRPYSRVLVMFALGNNNLSGNMIQNIKEISASPLPLVGSDKAMLVYQHCKGTPMLIQLSSDWRGEVVRDTVCIYGDVSVSATRDNISRVFEDVRRLYPSDHYGALLSSHGTGWLPTGYYDSGRMSTFSFGAEKDDNHKTVEMSLRELKDAIPYHLDYIIFDACLMGGIETAYELRSCTDAIVFSAAEILNGGMCYEELCNSLLKEKTINLEAFAKAFFDKYNKHTGIYQTATISCITTSKLERIAEVCAPLFDKYRKAIFSLGENDVQGFFTGFHPWFFDLRDILIKAGMTDEEAEVLDEALNDCITYSAATEYILSETKVNTYCGFSMYLPGAGNDYLNGFYTTLDWNKAAHLVD